MTERKLTPSELSYANTIIDKACDLSGVPKEILLSKRRTTDVCMVRHSIVYALKSATWFNFKNISMLLGRTNHTTAIHSYYLVLGQIGAVRRTPEMDEMVSLAKSLKQYIVIGGAAKDEPNEISKRNIVSEMRGMSCNMMSIVGVVSQLTYQIK